MSFFKNPHHSMRRGDGMSRGPEADFDMVQHGGQHGGHRRGGLHGGRGRHGDARPEGGPHGPRRGKRFGGEELRLMVLGLLASEPQHGYQLIRSFAAKSGDAYAPSPGVIYPLLTLLLDMELVGRPQGEPGTRQLYALTDTGTAEVETNRAAIDALFARLGAMAQIAARTDGAPVRRAVHNLRSAVVERLGREGTPESLPFDVAAIIDAATQQIERL